MTLLRSIILLAGATLLTHCAYGDDVSRIVVERSDGTKTVFVPQTEPPPVVPPVVPPVTPPVNQPPVPPVITPAGPAAGFTDLPLTPGAREYFVADSGKDTNTGLTPDKPLRTLQKAESLLRNNTGDRIRPLAGSTFFGTVKWSKSKSGMIAYGDGPRPILSTKGAGIVATSGFTDVAFVGLDLYASNRNPDAAGFDRSAPETYGFDLRKSGISKLLIEDCRDSFFGNGIAVHATDIRSMDRSKWNHEITIRRNISRYTWALRNYGGQGNYLSNCYNVTLSENVGYCNGWHPKIKGTERNQYRHWLYGGDLNDGFTITDNLIYRPAAQGIQQRSNATVTGNVIVDAQTGITVCGFVNSVERNAILGGHGNDVEPNKGVGHSGIVGAGLSNSIRGNWLWGYQNAKLTYAAPAIEITRREWTPPGNITFTVERNAINGWPGKQRSYMGQLGEMDLGKNPAVRWPEASKVWPDEAWMSQLTNRPRGVWYPEKSAAAIIKEFQNAGSSH